MQPFSHLGHLCGWPYVGCICRGTTLDCIAVNLLSPLAQAFSGLCTQHCRCEETFKGEPHPEAYTIVEEESDSLVQDPSLDAPRPLREGERRTAMDGGGESNSDDIHSWGPPWVSPYRQRPGTTQGTESGAGRATFDPGPNGFGDSDSPPGTPPARGHAEGASNSRQWDAFPRPGMRNEGFWARMSALADAADPRPPTGSAPTVPAAAVESDPSLPGPLAKRRVPTTVVCFPHPHSPGLRPSTHKPRLIIFDHPQHLQCVGDIPREDDRPIRWFDTRFQSLANFCGRRYVGCDCDGPRLNCANPAPAAPALHQLFGGKCMRECRCVEAVEGDKVDDAEDTSDPGPTDDDDFGGNDTGSMGDDEEESDGGVDRPPPYYVPANQVEAVGRWDVTRWQRNRDDLANRLAAYREAVRNAAGSASQPAPPYVPPEPQAGSPRPPALARVAPPSRGMWKRRARVDVPQSPSVAGKTSNSAELTIPAQLEKRRAPMIGVRHPSAKRTPTLGRR